MASDELRLLVGVRKTIARGALPQLRWRLEDHHRPFVRLRTGIEDRPVIVKILSYLGLPTLAPPRAPARRVDLFQRI